MSFELCVLIAAIALGLVHIGAASFAFKAQVGNAYTVGPRDAGLQPERRAARLARANANYLETFAYFAAAVLAVELSSAAGALSHWRALCYIAGRLLYLPLYAAGIRWLRTWSWNLRHWGSRWSRCSRLSNR